MYRLFTRFLTVCSLSGWIARSIAGTSKNLTTRSGSRSSNPSIWPGCFMTGRIYCTPRAMWKLSWFLRDFGYDSELLGNNAVDDKALVDLRGVVKVSEFNTHGISILNFDSFAPAARWEELSGFTGSEQGGSEVTS